MNVYFYHTENIQHILREYTKGVFPGHLLYGATRLSKYGIDVVWHKSIQSTSRLRQMLHSLWGVLRCYHYIDAIYATHYQGIELVIFLRAIRLLRKPIVIWIHQPILTSHKWWREWLGRLFFKGIDHMFFFSQKMLDDSLASAKTSPTCMHIGHWGPDLDFYDRLNSEHPFGLRNGFISTGRELRDMPTLVEAFNRTGLPIDIYVSRQTGGINYEHVFDNLMPRANVQVNFVEGLIPYELCQIVNRHACVTICCQETNYTVGLTTVVEALALGLPILISRNPQIPINIEEEGCGPTIPYYDIESWKQAILYISQHPKEAVEMGHRGRELAEKQFNDEICGFDVASILLST